MFARYALVWLAGDTPQNGGILHSLADQALRRAINASCTLNGARRLRTRW